MQKWNISVNRAQIVDGKNGVIHLVTFTPRDMVISKRSYLALLENIMNYWVLSYC